MDPFTQALVEQHNQSRQQLMEHLLRTQTQMPNVLPMGISPYSHIQSPGMAFGGGGQPLALPGAAPQAAQPQQGPAPLALPGAPPPEWAAFLRDPNATIGGYNVNTAGEGRGQTSDEDRAWAEQNPQGYSGDPNAQFTETYPDGSSAIVGQPGW